MATATATATKTTATATKTTATATKTTEEVGERVEALFGHLESHKAILTTCTDLYKTLTTHLTSLHQSLSLQSQTFSSNLQSLPSPSLPLPDRLSSLSSLIDSRKRSALSELSNPPFPQTLASLCRRMDAAGLLGFLASARYDSPSHDAAMKEALAECVDAPRLVLDVAEEFVGLKGGGGGLTDMRWACGVVVGGLFPREEVGFAGRIVERAARVVEAWKGTMAEGVGAAEVGLFLQVVIGFGLKERLDEAFLKKLVLDFTSMRNFMPKLAVPLFGDKIGDIINELINSGKEIEAIYFASEAGLTQRFQPASLLNTYLNNSKSKAADILKKDSSSLFFMSESVNLEIKSIKTVIKCVEDLALEKQFPIDDLRDRLASLEKTKGSKKKKSAAPTPAPNRPSKKRVHGAGGSRNSNQPAYRSTKSAKISNSYLSSFARRNRAPLPHQSPVARYPGAYNYPTQAAYETTPTAASYSSIYGGSLASSSSVPPYPHYSLPAHNVSVASSHPSDSISSSISMYGAQPSYNPYDLGAASVPAYEP